MFSRTLLASSCQRALSLRRFRASRRQIGDRQFSDESRDKPTGGSSEEEAARIAELLKGAANFNETGDPNWSTTPYPEGAPSQPESERVRPPKQDPTDASILLFPGQGTLKVGMVQKYLRFPRVKDLYENANETLGYDLLKLSLQGPQERLDRTEFNQPATVVASLAALEQLWEERPRVIDSCKAAAGYSLGEITALIFSGAITIDAGIKLAGIRGAAMQAASDETPQGMLSVFCSASAKITNICKDAEDWALNLGVENPICRVAIYQYTQGKVVGGNEEALKYIEQNGAKAGLRQIRRLPVSGAFHTPLMEPALKPFMKALANVELEEPRIDIYSNKSGRPYHSVRDIKKLLPKQMVSSVKWEQILHALYERPPGLAFPRTFDLGSAGTMKTILKRVNAKAAESCYDL